MRSRYTMGVLIAAGFVFGWVIARSKVKDPRYGGRPLSAWLADLDLENSGAPEPAVRAIQVIGSNSFPVLTSMIRFEDPLWRRELMLLNAHQPFLLIPVTPASVIRNRAVQGYIALGARGKQNVPALIRLLETESSPQVRSSVAAALGGIGPEAKPAIPVLLRASEDTNAEVRKESLWALANIQRWCPDSRF